MIEVHNKFGLRSVRTFPSYSRTVDLLTNYLNTSRRINRKSEIFEKQKRKISFDLGFDEIKYKRICQKHR